MHQPFTTRTDGRSSELRGGFSASPLPDSEGLGLVEGVALVCWLQPGQGAWYQDVSAVQRDSADGGADVPQYLPQTGQVWAKLHSPERET